MQLMTPPALMNAVRRRAYLFCFLLLFLWAAGPSGWAQAEWYA